MSVTLLSLLNLTRTFLAELIGIVETGTARLRDCTVQLEANKAKKAECESAIAVARGKCDEYTKSDVMRLQGEYTCIRPLHVHIGLSLRLVWT